MPGAQAYDHGFDLAASFADLGMNVEVLVQARCRPFSVELNACACSINPDNLKLCHVLSCLRRALLESDVCCIYPSLCRDKCTSTDLHKDLSFAREWPLKFAGDNLQVDRLVQLLETPVFTPLRLQLLHPAHHPALLRCAL